MAFYQSAFGGDLTITSRGDVDPGAQGAERDQVINAALSGDDVTIRASDRADVDTNAQNRVALSIVGDEEKRLRDLFDALAVDGSAIIPLEKQFWGDVFGALTDKYGISWQVNIESRGDAPTP